MLTPIEFATFVLDPSTNSPVLILRETGGSRTVSMTVSHPEATAIATRTLGMEPERPLAVDLIKVLMDRLDARMSKVVIDKSTDASATGRMYLQAGTRLEVIECRPADAIAIALRCSAPIFATETLLESSSSEPPMSGPDRLRSTIATMNTVDFGRYFVE